MPNTAIIAQADADSLALPALVDRAAAVLSNARSSAEVLEARDMASVAYDAAKKAARFAKAKNAADSLIAAAHRAQADALTIEAQAKRRLADEYDAAQERGEVATVGKRSQAERLIEAPPSAADIGLSRKDIHEARLIRDAEVSDPGIIKRTLDEAIEAGEEPTKAKVRRAVLQRVAPPQAQPAPSRGKQAVREKVCAALITLSGLPPAAEVAKYFRDEDAAIIVNERIDDASEWLAAFAAAWRK